MTVAHILRFRQRAVSGASLYKYDFFKLIAKIHGATNANITINLAHPNDKSAIQLKFSIK